MNKSELLENYTAEQLSDMVVKLDIASEMSAKQIYNLESKINNLEEENGRLQAKVDTYNEYLLPRCTKEARKLIDGNHFIGVMIVSCGEWNNRGKTERENVILPKEYENEIKEILNINTSEIKDDCHRFSIEGLQRYLKMDSPKKQAEIDYLKEQLNRSQTTITQIDEILEELFGVKHDAVKYGEFEQFLREKVMEKVSDFLPTEPIKVADMLISATYTRKKGDMEMALHKAFGNNKDTFMENKYSISELRQIAEHLLVFCNANGENENETNR